MNEIPQTRTTDHQSNDLRPKGSHPLQVGTERDKGQETRSPRAFVDQRLRSLDAYRGLIMIIPAFGGFGLGRTLKMYLGQDIFQLLGSGYEPMLQSIMTGLVFWLVCYWLYRRKFFIRI